MSIAQHRPYRAHGYPAWRTLVKASDNVTFHDVARLADTEYFRVYRMSQGHAETSPKVWEALSKLFGHSVSDLQEAVAIRMQLIAEDGGDAS